MLLTVNFCVDLVVRLLESMFLLVPCACSHMCSTCFHLWENDDRNERKKSLFWENDSMSALLLGHDDCRASFAGKHSGD